MTDPATAPPLCYPVEDAEGASPFSCFLGMSTYVIVGAVISWGIAWAWYKYVFPKVQEELSGGGGMGRAAVVSALAFLVFAWAFGTFLQNRQVADFGDAMRVGFRVWIGFLLPVVVTGWAAARKSMNALIASAGLWLVVSLVLIVLATWMLPIAGR